ncbi:NAD(P)H-dependent oxidoreductase [Maribellus maritimus]|uniref:NAD(P)H-dependent oxidoreductase n=1 Tax=Maribellus maritimus TaxID=2870838 RepID=UPI001EEC62E1|nr:NAD(P)H-dependent oxidoreductase [Maribellus maritimus]MCG6185808.1 NAD(P)H-dependent oxidoreductase [Maribellus maritimus]
MNILVVLAHPDKNSFNYAIAQTCIKQLIENEHSVIFHDLYRENFDPVLNTPEIPKKGVIDEIIKKHCEDLVKSDGIIIVHPNWWGQPPALLKGWIDRVIRPGIAYEFEEEDGGEGVPVGLLKAKTAVVFNTSNTSKERENNIFLDPLETLWKNCIFDLCGVKEFYRKMFRIIVTSTTTERKYWLDEVKTTVGSFFPLANKFE